MLVVTTARYFGPAAPHYPYKTLRRLGERPVKPWGEERARLSVREPPPPPTPLAAAAAVEKHPDGVVGLLRTALRCNAKARLPSPPFARRQLTRLRAQGDHGHAYHLAALALVAAAEDEAVVACAREQQREARLGALLSVWRSTTEDAAGREERAQAAVAAAAKRRADRQAASVPKPRQGYTKALLRLLHVRTCCSCRALRPRSLLWRIVQQKAPPPPPAPARPAQPPKLPKLRKICGHWTRRPRVRGRVGGAGAQPATGLLPPRSVRIVRLAGGASEHLQSDERFWTLGGRVRSVRSAYVCRRLVCVDYATKRRKIGSSLSCEVPQPLMVSLRDATVVEEAAAAAAAARGEAPPGVGEAEAQLLKLQPDLAPCDAASMRGPPDKWPAPPIEPR